MLTCKLVKSYATTASVQTDFTHWAADGSFAYVLSISYTRPGHLFLECNAYAAGIGIMMNGNITNPTFNEYSQSKQAVIRVLII